MVIKLGEIYFVVSALFVFLCLQCFVTLLAGWQEGHLASKTLDWWSAGMVICLGQGADLHMVQLMPLPLTVSCSSKSRLVLLFCILKEIGVEQHDDDVRFSTGSRKMAVSRMHNENYTI